MADTFETKFNESQAEIADLRKRLVAAGEEKFKTEIEGLKAELAKSEAKVASLKTEVENVTASKKEAEKAVEAAKAEKAEVETKLTEAAKKLEEVALASVKASRVSTLVDKGVDKAEAEKIVDNYISLKDEHFSGIVELQAKLIEAKKAVPAVVPTETEKAEAAKKAEEEKKAADLAAAAEALKTAEASKDPALNVNSEEVEGAIAGLSEHFANVLNKKSQKKSK